MCDWLNDWMNLPTNYLLLLTYYLFPPTCLPTTCLSAESASEKMKQLTDKVRDFMTKYTTLKSQYEILESSNEKVAEFSAALQSKVSVIDNVSACVCLCVYEFLCPYLIVCCDVYICVCIFIYLIFKCFA